MVEAVELRFKRHTAKQLRQRWSQVVLVFPDGSEQIAVAVMLRRYAWQFARSWNRIKMHGAKAVVRPISIPDTRTA